MRWKPWRAWPLTMSRRRDCLAEFIFVAIVGWMAFRPVTGCVAVAVAWIVLHESDPDAVGAMLAMLLAVGIAGYTGSDWRWRLPALPLWCGCCRVVAWPFLRLDGGSDTMSGSAGWRGECNTLDGSVADGGAADGGSSSSGSDSAGQSGSDFTGSAPMNRAVLLPSIHWESDSWCDCPLWCDTSGRAVYWLHAWRYGGAMESTNAAWHKLSWLTAISRNARLRTFTITYPMIWHT